jgi:hypothetical protein
MSIDPSQFMLVNITDTCAVWHVLSSNTLYQAALLAKCTFVITDCVQYECLYKKRSRPTEHHIELRNRLKEQQKKGKFLSHPLDIEDLVLVSTSDYQRFGKGEISSLAFAMKNRLAFLTDDQGARNLAKAVKHTPTQTTPHLLSWLIFHNKLGDSCKDKVIQEHAELGCSLKKYFEEGYEIALQCRLKSKLILAE